MMSLVASIDAIVFEVVGDARGAPCPTRQNAPVVAGIRGKEPGVAERPAAVHVAQRRVFRAVVGIEQHERVAAAEDVGALCRDGLGGLGRGRTAACASRRRGGCRVARRRGHRPDEQQHVFSLSLIRSLRQARQHHSARRCPSLEDHRGKRTSLHGREHADVEAQLRLRAERQANEPVLDGAAQHELGLDLPPLHVPRRRRHLPDGVVRQGAPHFLPPRFPLAPGRDGRAVVHHHDVRHGRAHRQRVHTGKSSQLRRDRRHRNLARLGAAGGRSACALRLREARRSGQRDARDRGDGKRREELWRYLRAIILSILCRWRTGACGCAGRSCPTRSPATR